VGGVRAVGLPGNLSVYGVGDTLDEALLDLGEGIRTALADGPIPEELTRGNHCRHRGRGLMPIRAGTLSAICREVGRTAQQLRDLL